MTPPLHLDFPALLEWLLDLGAASGPAEPAAGAGAGQRNLPLACLILAQPRAAAACALQLHFAAAITAAPSPGIPLLALPSPLVCRRRTLLRLLLLLVLLRSCRRPSAGVPQQGRQHCPGGHMSSTPQACLDLFHSMDARLAALHQAGTPPRMIPTPAPPQTGCWPSSTNTRTRCSHQAGSARPSLGSLGVLLASPAPASDVHLASQSYLLPWAPAPCSPPLQAARATRATPASLTAPPSSTTSCTPRSRRTRMATGACGQGARQEGAASAAPPLLLLPHSRIEVASTRSGIVVSRLHMIGLAVGSSARRAHPACMRMGLAPRLRPSSSFRQRCRAQGC